MTDAMHLMIATGGKCSLCGEWAPVLHELVFAIEKGHVRRMDVCADCLQKRSTEVPA
jgi:hypothetical protein